MGGGGGVFDTVANVATLGGYDALDINGSKAKGAAIGAQTSATGNANAAFVIRTLNSNPTLIRTMRRVVRL